ncbi:MAG: UvrD-helicase domain-containing protein, partial [Alphaproteobacteria bacterium]
GIDHVLIDEAQDTSPNQWAIVKAVTEEFFNGLGAADKVRTVFAVGDRKQSIYSFQGADPREFENMRRYFAAKASNFDEVKLEVSFRSTATVLDSVNTVFGDEYAKQGVVLEGEDITHIPFRLGDGGRVELWPLVEPQVGENPDMWRPPVDRVPGESTSSRLAKMIAAKIKEQVSRGDILVSQNRSVRYRDYMILVQRRNSFVEEMVRECKNAGVNVSGVDKIRLLEQIAVQDLVALGQFLLLPTDDLTLATVLKSPLFGLNDDDLFVLCYNRGGASVWTRLCDNPDYRRTYLQLRELLDMADYVRPFELYGYVLNKQGGRKKFVERMGLEVEDGLDEFVNLTLAYEQEHIPSLQGFVQWIAGDEVEIKRELEQSEADAVRIMTVHGSKGLQAPIVILPDT